MKKRSLIYGLCLSTAILLSACGNSANAKVEPSAESVVSPMDYKYSEKTKTELYFASDSKTVYDISDNVSNYSSGDLFLDSDGLDKVFGLKQLTPTEEDKNLFKSYETENSFDGSTGDIVKFANDKLTLLTRVGSTLYLANGEVKTFSYPPIEDEGKLSLPMFDIAFSSGYDSIGNSVAGDHTLPLVVTVRGQRSDICWTSIVLLLESVCPKPCWNRVRQTGSQRMDAILSVDHDLLRAA